VALDWTPNTNHTGLYVANALGYYRDVGLKTTLVQPPENGALSLLAAGRVEFGISFQEEIAAARTASSPLPVVAVAAIMEHNLSGLISLKETGIETPKDLEGKRYASWETPLEIALLQNIITSDGGDPALLRLVPNTVTDIFSALSTDIDVIWIFYPWDGMAAITREMDFNYLEFRELNPVFDFYTPVLATTDTLVEQETAMVTAFLEATRQGYQYAIAHPAEAAEILLAAVPELEAAMVHASQQYLADHYAEDASKWGYIASERWDSFYQWLYDEGITAINLVGTGYRNILK